MRPELIGTSRDTNVYFVDNPFNYSAQDVIAIERRTYKAYYKGYLIGSLAHDKSRFDTFDDSKFYRLQAGTYKEEKPKKEEKKKVQEEKKPASKKVEESVPADDLVSIALGSVQTFGDEVFAELKNSLDKMMEGMKEWI